MELVSTPWHIVGALLVFLVGGVIAVAFAQRIATALPRALAVYTWHSCFCVFYAVYVLHEGGDALGSTR
jgi:hypothetical protein